MKIIFAGTAEIAVPVLQSLLKSHHKISAVLTQPARPSGRGQKLTASPVKKLSVSYNIPVYQPETLKDLTTQKQLQEIHADVLVCVAYGLLIPDVILNMFKFGCVNLHPSLLPHFRGAAPIQRAIESCEKTTGVTIMRMASKLDAGDIYAQEILPIKLTDTAATLSIKAAELGAQMLLKVLTDIEKGVAKLTPQNESQVTYANKITKEEGLIDWHKSAKEIDCMIRAFNPWPVAYAIIDNQVIRIWQAEPLKDDVQIKLKASPGTIIQVGANGLDVMTGGGVLRLLKIQLPGGKQLAIADILNAHHKMFDIGNIFN